MPGKKRVNRRSMSRGAMSRTVLFADFLESANSTRGRAGEEHISQTLQVPVLDCIPLYLVHVKGGGTCRQGSESSSCACPAIVS